MCAELALEILLIAHGSTYKRFFHHDGIDNEITYEEINERMLQIIEEVGELARAIKELGKK